MKIASGAIQVAFPTCQMLLLPKRLKPKKMKCQKRSLQRQRNPCQGRNSPQNRPRPKPLQKPRSHLPRNARARKVSPVTNPLRLSRKRKPWIRRSERHPILPRTLRMYPPALSQLTPSSSRPRCPPHPATETTATGVALATSRRRRRARGRRRRIPSPQPQGLRFLQKKVQQKFQAAMHLRKKLP